MAEPEQIKLKRKYTDKKTKGNQKAGGGNSGHKDRRRKKVGGGHQNPLEKVMVLTATGKTTWMWRERVGKR